MNQKQKFALGGAVGAVLLLYLTGLLWPLIRLVLSFVAVVGLTATAFFGIRYFHEKKRTSENQDANEPQPGNAITSVVATMITLLLLSFVPTDDSQPATELAKESSAVVERSAPESQPRERTTRSTVATKTPGEEAKTNPLVSASQQTTATFKAETKTRTSQPQSRSPALSPSQVMKTKPKVPAAEADHAAAEFMGALLGAAMEQERREQSDPRYQRFQQSLERARVCPRCDGAGSYRYVDGQGVLQVRSCPSCTIPGKSF